jgi:hypothetical protein
MGAPGDAKCSPTVASMQQTWQGSNHLKTISGGTPQPRGEPASPLHAQTSASIPAAQLARVMSEHRPSERQGAGKTGCWLHPRPRVQCRKHTSYSPQVQPKRPGLPCATVLTALCELFPVSVTHSHRRLPITARRARRADVAISTDLAPAQGCQDHTPSPSAWRRSSARKARALDA